ncbi:MAG: hypothetical protein F2813_02745 [Actinobacteria bacterium]|uniref:Unannotated protein n=1 Tax=freshwater metagenome TaxID=449393 RepID=A0A6J5ZMV1_9ZZZZ|nr:hypothetical protein [Actinomycetota bacterium]
MANDSRRPVITGVAQATWRDGNAPDPIMMCAEVIAAAMQDAGGGDLLSRVDAIGVVDIASRRWSDPAALVASAMGITPKLTMRTELGGDGPLRLIAELSSRIAAGELDCAVVCGAEALSTLAQSMRSGSEPSWSPLDDESEPDVLVGSDRFPATEAEAAANMIAPIIVYPLFEHALWAEQGGTIEEHRGRLGQLWARFSKVAEDNPHAWARDFPGAAEIATPAPGNRLVTLPYTKLLNSNIQTDQAAAVILCSEETARELGVPRDRWVFPLGFGHAEEHWFVSSRDRLDRSPALGIAAAGALEAAGLGLGDVAHLDIYSCFPSAVQLACKELGIDPWSESRPLTVTGGLSFAGGPGNNYATHAVCSMVERLREDPGATGMTTAVGWYMTKHAAALFSASPPERPLSTFDGRKAAASLPSREMAGDRSGVAAAETATLVYDREGSATVATLTGIFEDGARAVAQSTEPELLKLIGNEQVAGRDLAFAGDGTASVV